MPAAGSLVVAGQGMSRRLSFHVRLRIRSRSNSASPPSTVSMSRPWAVVVSAQAIAPKCEPGLTPGDRCQRVQQVAGGSRQPVEPRQRLP